MRNFVKLLYNEPLFKDFPSIKNYTLTNSLNYNFYNIEKDI